MCDVGSNQLAQSEGSVRAFKTVRFIGQPRVRTGTDFSVVARLK
jgi:hypothetical protein